MMQINHETSWVERSCRDDEAEKSKCYGEEKRCTTGSSYIHTNNMRMHNMDADAGEKKGRQMQCRKCKEHSCARRNDHGACASTMPAMSKAAGRIKEELSCEDGTLWPENVGQELMVRASKRHCELGSKQVTELIPAPILWTQHLERCGHYSRSGMQRRRWSWVLVYVENDRRAQQWRFMHLERCGR